MNPDITKYFFSDLRSKIHPEINLSVFYHDREELFAYNALHELKITGDLLDSSQFDQVAYIEKIASDIMTALNLTMPVDVTS